MNRNLWLTRGLRFLLFAGLFVAAAGLATQALWNWLMPALFRLPAISLPQALGLLLLSRLLLGGFRGGGRAGAWARQRRAWRQHMAGRLEHLSPEARESFREQMRHKCGLGWAKPGPPASTEARASAS